MPNLDRVYTVTKTFAEDGRLPEIDSYTEEEILKLPFDQFVKNLVQQDDFESIEIRHSTYLTTVQRIIAVTPNKERDRSEIIYSLSVEDIYLTAESFGREEKDLTPAVVEEVIRQIGKMDFSDISAVIASMIEDAVEEERQEKEAENAG